MEMSAFHVLAVFPAVLDQTCSGFLQVVNEEKIGCKFKRVNGYLFPHEDTKDAKEKLASELKTCSKIGLPVKMV